MFPWIKPSALRRAGRYGGTPHNLRPGESLSNANEEKKQARRVGNALVQRIWRLVSLENKNQGAPVTAAAKNALVTPTASFRSSRTTMQDLG
jgi:hypothetical protein